MSESSKGALYERRVIQRLARMKVTATNSTKKAMMLRQVSVVSSLQQAARRSVYQVLGRTACPYLSPSPAFL